MKKSEKAIASYQKRLYKREPIQINNHNTNVNFNIPSVSEHDLVFTPKSFQ